MPGIAQLARSEEEKYNSARSPEISGRFSLSLLVLHLHGNLLKLSRSQQKIICTYQNERLSLGMRKASKNNFSQNELSQYFKEGIDSAR